MNEAPDLLTAHEVAEMFRVTVSTVSRWVRDGHLEVIRLPTGTVRFRRPDVLALLGRTSSDTKAAS